FPLSTSTVTPNWRHPLCCPLDVIGSRRHELSNRRPAPGAYHLSGIKNRPCCPVGFWRPDQGPQRTPESFAGKVAPQLTTCFCQSEKDLIRSAVAKPQN